MIAAQLEEDPQIVISALQVLSRATNEPTKNNRKQNDEMSKQMNLLTEVFLISKEIANLVLNRNVLSVAVNTEAKLLDVNARLLDSMFLNLPSLSPQQIKYTQEVHFSFILCRFCK
jgi:hypothetical protein